MRLSRPCYDKPHRCPGWAGGGWKFASSDRHDCGGYVTAGRPWTSGRDEDYPGHPGEYPWKFGRCNRCDVLTWPYGIRLLDPTSYLMRARRRWRWWLEDRRLA